MTENKAEIINVHNSDFNVEKYLQLMLSFAYFYPILSGPRWSHLAVTTVVLNSSWVSWHQFSYKGFCNLISHELSVQFESGSRKVEFQKIKSEDQNYFSE